MIEGLKVELSSEHLVEHLTKRRDYHRRTEAIYRRQYAETEEEHHGVSDQFYQKGSASSIRDRIKAAADSHGARAKYFDILCSHLVRDETYRLSEMELRHIEMLDD